MKQTVGIIGAGKISMAVARHLLGAGYSVLVSSSRAPHEFELILDVMVPGAQGVWTSELIERSDVVILALPLSKVETLPLKQLAGKVVIDATNHWLEVDGHFPELRDFPGTSSQYVESLMPGAHVYKAFNHLGYHDVDQLARPAGSDDRVGMGVAGAPTADLDTVMTLVEDSGFTPVYFGELSSTRVLEGGHPAFGLAAAAAELRELVEEDPERLLARQL